MSGWRAPLLSVQPELCARSQRGQDSEQLVTNYSITQLKNAGDSADGPRVASCFRAELHANFSFLQEDAWLYRMQRACTSKFQPDLVQ